MKKQTLIITSEIGNIIGVQYFIEQLVNEIELEGKIFDRINSAIVEAVNNAILHGNHNDKTKLVIIEAEIDKDTITISVRDEGEGFDYSNITDPTIPENITKATGRGLYLIKTLSDNLEFLNHGSQVIMVFFLNSES
jgi:serine-protein kinase rsbW